MKQNITPKQFNELSEKGKDKLWSWIEAGHDSLNMPLLSIGQLIEFLDDTFLDINLDTWEDRGDFWQVTSLEKKFKETLEPELCDALWETVKEVLDI